MQSNTKRSRIAPTKAGTSKLTETTRVFIETNFKEYDRRMKKHKEYISSLNRLIVVLNEFRDVDMTKADEIIKEPIMFSQKTVLWSKRKVNSMDLSYQKLVDVLEIDVVELEMLAREFSKLNPNDYQEPNIEDFKVYTNRLDQVERLNALNRIIESVNDLRPSENDWNLKQLNSSLMKSFNGRFVSSEYNIFIPKPNLKYVLSGKVI
jgi:hypothetical protein